MSENKNGIALALGTFDGFHLGHKKVIAHLFEYF